MKKNKKIYAIVTFFLFFSILTVNKTITFANDGIEVPTEGEIILYDDTSISNTESSINKPQSSNKLGSYSSPSSEENMLKPKGRLPSTGDLVKMGVLASGMLLIASVIIFYLLNKHLKKEKGQ